MTRCCRHCQVANFTCSGVQLLSHDALILLISINGKVQAVKPVIQWQYQLRTLPKFCWMLGACGLTKWILLTLSGNTVSSSSSLAASHSLARSIPHVSSPLPSQVSFRSFIFSPLFFVLLHFFLRRPFLPHVRCRGDRFRCRPITLLSYTSVTH